MKERRISLLPSSTTSKRQRKNNSEAKHKRKHRIQTLNTSESIASIFNAVKSKVVFFIFIFFLVRQLTDMWLLFMQYSSIEFDSLS